MTRLVQCFREKKDDFLFNRALKTHKILYQPVPMVDEQYSEYAFLKRYSVLNDKYILRKLHNTFFTLKDSRAGWVGAGLAHTDKAKYKPLVKMSLEHLYMYKSILKYIKKKPDEKFSILDVGCGLGYATVCLADNWNNSSITAIDYDEKAIELAKTLNHQPNIEYINCDFLSFEIKSQYDYVLLIDVLEHVKAENHKAFITHCMDNLKPEGRLFIITPNAVNEKDGKHSHIGLLNKERMNQFIEKYRDIIIDSFFIKDNLLGTGIIEQFVEYAPLDDFEKYQEKDKYNYTSHVGIVIKK